MAAGSGVSMIGVPSLRSFQHSGNHTTNHTRIFDCPPNKEEGIVTLILGILGIVTNIILMLLILINKHMRRWSHGLLFHQGAVDCARSSILLPLAWSILRCEPVKKCSFLETAFLLLVTVSAVNMLSTVLNDSPVFPDDESDDEFVSGPLQMDSPQCVLFGSFMIWFASITINLGPTFLSGALAARSEISRNVPSCPMIHGPFRHYILNALWIMINGICVTLTVFHLRKLHKDLTKANVEAVKVTGLLTTLVNVTGNVPSSSARNDAALESQDHIDEKGVGIRSAVDEHQRMRNYLKRIEQEGVQKVKMFLIIISAYIVLWCPLYFVTLVKHRSISNKTGYEITMKIAYSQTFVNPLLFIILHRGLRSAALNIVWGPIVGIVRCFVKNTDNMDLEVTYDNNTDYALHQMQDSNSMLVPPPPPPPLVQIPPEHTPPLPTAPFICPQSPYQSQV